MWWTPRQVNPARGQYNWSVVDSYIDAARAQGKQVALSLVPLTGAPHGDGTPDWVYQLNGIVPWEGRSNSGYSYKYPRWNDDHGIWDPWFWELIAAFGQRYDGDPRVHSVWIATLLYGESVTTVPGGGELGHNPIRFVDNCLDRYHAAFPHTPLIPLLTGNSDRLRLCHKAWSLGMAAGFNGLCGDANNQVQHKPTEGAGLMQIGHAAVAQGLPMKWEHAYNGVSQGETMAAIAAFLANGGTVLDLPGRGAPDDPHLDTLAAIPGLWEWTWQMMQVPVTQRGVWFARNTKNPGGVDQPGVLADWEHGYPGPWEAHITTNATCYAPNSAEWKAAPQALTSTLEGYLGLGRCEEGLEITLDLPAGEYAVQAILAKDDDPGWQMLNVQSLVTSPGTIRYAAPCWVHRVTAIPAATEEPGEPDPPEEPGEHETALAAKVEALAADVAASRAQAEQAGEALATLHTDLAALTDKVATMLDTVAALNQDQATHEGKLADLEQDLQGLGSRIVYLESLLREDLRAKIEDIRDLLGEV